MGRRRMSELAFIRRTRPARPGFPSSPRSERIACGDPVPRPRRRGAGRAAGRCGAVRRPSHACSPAARSVRCAPSPPGPRLPAVLSTAGSRQVMGRDSLRGSASPAAIRSPGPAVRGRGADAGFRVVRRPSHAGSPAARSVPLRSLSTWPPAPRRAVHGRLASGRGRKIPFRAHRLRRSDRPPPLRGAGAARGRPVPGRVPRGTHAGSDTPLPRPPGPFAALPLHLAPGLDAVSFGELCGLRGSWPSLPRSRALRPAGRVSVFPLLTACEREFTCSRSEGEKHAFGGCD